MARRDPLPYWARKRAQQREAEANERAADRIGTLMGLEGEDPNTVIDASRQLVRAAFSRGSFYCLDCIPPGATLVDMAPDTPCELCERPVSAARRKTA